MDLLTCHYVLIIVFIFRCDSRCDLGVRYCIHHHTLASLTLTSLAFFHYLWYYIKHVLLFIWFTNESSPTKLIIGYQSLANWYFKISPSYIWTFCRKFLILCIFVSIVVILMPFVLLTSTLWPSMSKLCILLFYPISSHNPINFCYISSPLSSCLSPPSPSPL